MLILLLEKEANLIQGDKMNKVKTQEDLDYLMMNTYIILIIKTKDQRPVVMLRDKETQAQCHN